MCIFSSRAQLVAPKLSPIIQNTDGAYLHLLDRDDLTLKVTPTLEFTAISRSGKKKTLRAALLCMIDWRARGIG